MKGFAVICGDEITIWPSLENAERYLGAGRHAGPEKKPAPAHAIPTTPPRIVEVELMSYDVSPAEAFARAYEIECKAFRQLQPPPRAEA